MHDTNDTGRILAGYDLPEHDIDSILAEYGLPELPEPAGDDGETAELVLFRSQQENIPLGGDFALADAMDYCNQDDTHGDGWFTGWRRS
jgi:hypothetical protein